VWCVCVCLCLCGCGCGWVLEEAELALAGTSIIYVCGWVGVRVCLLEEAQLALAGISIFFLNK
jgi:hypothetical protein